MSLLSAILSPFSKKKHEAVGKYEQDVAFFRALRRKVEAEPTKKGKAVALKEAIVALSDQNRHQVAKMVFASLVDESQREWDKKVDLFGAAIEYNLSRVGKEKDALGEIYQKESGDMTQEVRTRVPLLIQTLKGLAGQWERSEDVGAFAANLKERYAHSSADVGKVVQALAQERQEGRRQALMGMLLSRAADERLHVAARLEAIEPKSPLVEGWKALMQRLGAGDDVVSDIKEQERLIAVALPKKIQAFAEKIAGVAVA